MAEVALAGVGLALSVAQTLFSALQTKKVREMCSMFGYETQLKELEETMKTIKEALIDFDSKRQGLTNEGKDWVEKLKDAVYDVDDLLDEFTTIAKQRNQIWNAKFSDKVCHFFSRNNKLFDALKVSREVKLLGEKLDANAKNHAYFGSVDVNKPVKREETCSTVSDIEIIGRDQDMEAIVGMLLSDDRSSDHNVSYVNIVGIAGLGKTTLAQLVYNHERVTAAFSKRIWVCVSEEFSVGEILGKMLGEKKDLTLEKMKTEVQTLLEKKRYLLVLDDVWNESHDEWRKLKPFLASDVTGSKIIVTSRSKKVASSIGEDSVMYELKGLSEDKSWSLFKRIAFGVKDRDDLVEIGKDIVKKCVNVPLAIRVIASLLYDQHKGLWLSFKDIDLAIMCNGEDRIMQTLMFSYYHLTPELKSCFSFCSLFPKDYVIPKKELISLWLGEGFLVPAHHGQSIEDAGERNFLILLNRCFFQDIKFDEHGHVYSFKMHDLMHDLALKVAGKESMNMTQTGKGQLGNNIRHLSTDEKLTSSTACMRDTLRTYIQWNSHSASSRDLKSITNCRKLRVLRIHCYCKTLPNTLGKLLHLRYLDLSKNEMKLLPKSITNLHNLQILKLTECTNLKELPEDISKLVNLRILDTYECNGLTHMPRGIDKLENLHTLSQLVVGGVDWKQVKGMKLVDLQTLKNLKGDLSIRIQDFHLNNMPSATEKAFTLKEAHNLEIICGSYYCEQGGSRNLYNCSSKVDQSEVHETLVEGICPNDDIVRIKIVGYQGMKMPSWASMLVNVKVSNIKGLQQEATSSLSQLRHLKVLELHCLPNVEYIESEAAWELVSRPDNDNESKIVVFFPVLEKLVLKEMPKLKGWWREVRWEEMDGCLADDKRRRGNNEVDQSEVHEQVCPNNDIGRIEMVGYQGIKMPSWASMLVNVKVSNIKGLQQEVTSSLSQLCHLKVVELVELPNVEYIESEAAWELVSRPNNNNESKIVVFFPALEKLVLHMMPKLKGWWREVRWEEMDGCLADDANANGYGNGGIQEHATVTLPCFPRLRELDIWICESMMYFPPCPYLKKLDLREVNEALTFCNKKGSIVASGVTSISRPFSSDSSSSSSSDVLWFLEKLYIYDERVMNSVSKEFVGGVVHMVLYCRPQGNNKEGMQLVKEGFERCGSSLQHLKISECGKLREIGIEQLTNLQSLVIRNYNEVDEEDNESEEEEGMPWKNLQSLSSLEFHSCNMVELPKGLRYLGTSLQSLEISGPNKMEELGETICFLTSLQSLKISYCNKMEELGETIGFLTSLQSLEIDRCFKLKALPESLKFLTSLRLLCIFDCPKVKSLPEAMCHLTSLNRLYISFCPSYELKKRCQPGGEDWHKICHIPNIVTSKTWWW